MSIPALSKSRPLVGHLLEFLRGPIELMARAQKEGGELIKFRLANRDMYLFSGTEAHEAYFRAPDEQFNQREAYQFMVPVFGKGVVYDVEPEIMYEQLGFVLPALRIKRMETYGELIAEEVRRSTESWANHGTISLLEYTKELTTYTSTRCLLGKEFRENLTSEFARVYNDLEAGVSAIAVMNPHLPLPAFRKRDRARVKLQEMITAIVDQRRAKGVEGDDFMQTLMDSKYKDGRGLDANEITGILVALMFAGHHTSSVTAAWTMLELLSNPGYLIRVQAQLDEVSADGKAFSYDSLRELDLLENAVKETLRLHPPLIMVTRKVMYDFTYKDNLIPAGSYTVVCPPVSHRVASEFADPDRFDPDRWTDARGEITSPFKWVAFGAGKHRCTGNAFALMQIKTIFAVLLTHFRFELVGDPIEPDYQALVVGPKAPARIKYWRKA